MHRQLVFRRGMREYAALVRAQRSALQPSEDLLSRLVYGWGNSGWSAGNDYAAACVREAATSTGSILECGSGLTTLLVGLVCKSNGTTLHTLEHHQAWWAHVKGWVDRLGIEGAVNLHYSPLIDHGEFDWYSVPMGALPPRFSLVLCDGPPETTRGGRIGLVPLLRQHLDGALVLLDDVERPRETEIARIWRETHGATVEIRPGEAESGARGYARLRFPDRS
ncbi:MAG: class I SAM-dependent methyltransferase [Myxococcales bacterium]|nr:class I SAM-dependent methyltransferase [Myxococcales bacterium]